MKKSICKKLAFTFLSSTLFLSQVSFTSASAQPSAGTKRALLIGVWKYYKGPGYPNDLHTEPDVQAMKTILTEEFKVPAANITTVTAPDDTTKANIEKAFAKLVSDTNAGDQVYVHYSGHGSQVPDQDGDETIDGMDETIVPSDYNPTDEKTRADSQIRDDDLHKYIDQLLAKKPELVTMVFDCCQSGTVTRDVRLPHRGFKWEGAVPSRSVEANDVDKSGFADKQIEKNLVVISAARADQEAQETLSDHDTPMGLLTYSLGKALAKDRKTPTTTYRDVYEDIAVTIAAKKSSKPQNAQMEGKLDNVLMSGRVLKPDAFLAITRGGKGQVILEAGDLQNVTKDSVYELYQAGTKKAADAKSLGKFKVKTTFFTKAILEPADGTAPLPADVKAARAKELTHAFGALKLNVVVENMGEVGKKLSTQLDKEGRGFFTPIAKDAIATDADKWNIKLRYPEGKSAKDGELEVVRTDGFKLHTMKLDPTKLDNSQLASDLALRLREELRWSYLKGLGNESDSNVGVQIRAIPVEVTRNELDEVTGHKDKKPASEIKDIHSAELSAKDYFMLEIKIPEGQKDAFVTVLNLTANGQIVQSFPNSGEKSDANKFKAGEWHRLEPIFESKEPYGDIMKAVATSEPADFTPLLSSTRGSKGVTPLNPISQLFLAADASTRDASTVSVAPKGWATNHVEIVIVDAPKKETTAGSKEGSMEASN